AVLAVARAPSRTVASCAFVAVALGLALFAAGYRTTLQRGAADQAGFEVPLDFTAAEGPRLVKPLDAAPSQRFNALGGGATAYPVVRLGATTPGRGSTVLSPTVLGVPAGALGRMYWRSDFSTMSRRTLARRRTHAGELRPAGVPVPTGATSVTVAARGRGRSLDVRLVVEDERGRVSTLPLRRERSPVLSARLPRPHLRVVGI